MSTVATAPLLWCSSTSRRSVSARSSGVSPGSTSTVPSTSGDGLERDPDGVPGAALLGLHDGLRVRGDLGQVRR